MNLGFTVFRVVKWTCKGDTSETSPNSTRDNQLDRTKALRILTHRFQNAETGVYGLTVDIKCKGHIIIGRIDP